MRNIKNGKPESLDWVAMLVFIYYIGVSRLVILTHVYILCRP